MLHTDPSAREIRERIARDMARRAGLPPPPVHVAPPRQQCIRRRPWPPCPACRRRIPVPARAGRCLICLAEGRPHWTDREDSLIRQHYGALSKEQLALKLFYRVGTARSPMACVQRAHALGLDHRTTQGDWTVRDAAEALGITIHVIYAAIKRGDVTSRGTGKIRWISHDQFEALEAMFPAPPARSIGRPELMRRLGYGEAHASRLLRSGAIRGVMRGGVWYVDLDHVEAIEREMRETGAVRRSLLAVPGLDRAREKARQYARNARRAKRHADRAGPWMTFLEAQQTLGWRRVTLRRLLEEGHIAGRRENALWLVDRATVQALVSPGAGKRSQNARDEELELVARGRDPRRR